MAQLEWDTTDSRQYDVGVDHVVLYTAGLLQAGRYGVPWNGVTAITISPSITTTRVAYMDREKIVNLIKTEECAGSIEAYYSPEQFDYSDGSAFKGGINVRQQKKEPFHLAFRSKTDRGNKLHIIYNAKATPAEKSYSTYHDPEVDTLAWEFSTQSIDLFKHSPTALLTIDLSRSAPGPTQEVLDILYGAVDGYPRCPLPDEILTIFGVFEALEVIDHGDGSFTVSGSDSAVSMIGEGEFQLSASVVELLEEGTYQIHYTPR